LSEIFENEEIRKLCGDLDYDKSDSESMIKTTHASHEFENPPFKFTSDPTNLKESTFDLTLLKKELVSGNKNDLFNNSLQLNSLYQSVRLKALDDSIQSIKTKDL